MTDITGEKRSLDDDGSVGAGVKQQKLAGTVKRTAWLNNSTMFINHEYCYVTMLVHVFTSPKVATILGVVFPSNSR